MEKQSSSSIIKAIQDDVTALESSNDAKEIAGICEKLLHLLDEAQKVVNLNVEDQMLILHEFGLKLWNLVIAKKLGKLVSRTAIAQARHVALHLTYMVSLSEQSKTTSRKQQSMAMKVGKDWLECGNNTMAETCFIISTECYIKLQRLILDTGVKMNITDEQIKQSYDYMVQVHLYRAELAIRNNQHATAFDFVSKAKEIMEKYDLKANVLCTACYNFGLECYQKELYKYSEEWLRQSVEIGKNAPTIKSEQQASTRQLLAIVYMELKSEDSYNNALDVIEQSILDQPEVKSIHLKIKIKLLMNHEDESVLAAFRDLSMHPSIDITLALQTISLFAQNKRNALCLSGLEILDRKYQQVQDNIQIRLKKLELLLLDNQLDLAKEVIREELIRANQHSKVFTKSSLKQLHLLLWEQANAAFEGKDFENALYWYDCSLQFMRLCSDDKLNISKLQRNRAICFIERQQYQKALEITLEAEKEDQSSPQTIFLLHKVHLMMNENEKAIDAIKKLSAIKDSKKRETVHGLVCLAAQLAFQKGNREVAGVTLEILVNSHTGLGKELLVPLRCLARLKFAYLSNESKKEQLDLLLNLIGKAKGIFEDTDISQHNSEYEAEVLWFNKLAWNLALSSSEHVYAMESSFMLCHELSQLLPTNSQNQSQQKTCLLMATGCSLQLASDLHKEDKEKVLQKVLSNIVQCYKLIEMTSEDGGRDVTTGFLVCYEFDAKLQLGQSDVDELFEKVLAMDAKEKSDTLEKLTQLALRSDVGGSDVTIKTLQLTIKCELEKETINCTSLSKSVHHLIRLSLQKGNNTSADSKEAAFNYYQDAIAMVEKIKEDYPELEIVWLMTKAWNCGVHLYSAQHFEAAEKWCSVSMRFLKFLKNLKETYEPHMSSVFTDIISRIQQSRAQMEVEE